MFIDKIINILPVKSGYIKLLLGAVFIALIISMGIIVISNLFDFSIGSALPAASGAIGAAVFSTKNINKGHMFKY